LKRRGGSQGGFTGWEGMKMGGGYGQRSFLWTQWSVKKSTVVKRGEYIGEGHRKSDSFDEAQRPNFGSRTKLLLDGKEKKECEECKETPRRKTKHSRMREKRRGGRYCN